MVKETTLYDRLEVPTNASESDIIQAGRRLSKKWHPDKNHDNKAEAEQRFKQIRQAVEILSDAPRRAHYDQFGLSSGNDAVPPSAGSGAMPFPFPFPFGGAGHPFHANANSGPQPVQPPPPVVVHVTVTLEDVACGKEIHFSFSRQVECAACKANTRVTCNKCQGSGRVTHVTQINPMMVQQVMKECEDCNGRGKISHERCNVCNGKCSVMQNESASIRLQNHLHDGARLQMSGRGSVVNGLQGDLVLVLHVEPHPLLQQDGQDLYTEIELSLTEALFGFSRIVSLVRGYAIRIRYVGKTEYGSYKKVIGEGMNSRGDLHIRFVFTLPEIAKLDELRRLEQDAYTDVQKLEKLEVTENDHLPIEDRAVMDEEPPASRESSVDRDERTHDDHSSPPHPDMQQTCRPM